MKNADRILEMERRENELLKLRALALSTHFGQVILSVIHTHNRISINKLLSECQVAKKDLLDFLSLLQEAKLINLRGDDVVLAPQGKRFLANLVHLPR
ncbi:hypothetical protein HYR99_06990 [Candidatus Poribacteria bacterium]|nr:hypothetical protein [Candidatus Poribacteria bacterium]